MPILFIRQRKYYFWFFIVVCLAFLVQLTLTNELETLRVPQTEEDKIYTVSYGFIYENLPLQTFESVLQAYPSDLPAYSVIVLETSELDLIASVSSDKRTDISQTNIDDNISNEEASENIVHLSFCAAYPYLPSNMISVREALPRESEAIMLYAPTVSDFDTYSISINDCQIRLRKAGINAFTIPWVSFYSTLISYSDFQKADLSVKQVVLVFPDSLTASESDSLLEYMKTWGMLESVQQPLEATEDYYSLEKPAYFAIACISLISIVSNMGVLLFCFALSSHELSIYRICGASFLQTRLILLLNMGIVNLLALSVTSVTFIGIRHFVNSLNRVPLSFSFYCFNSMAYLLGEVGCLVFVFLFDFVKQGQKIEVKDAL